MTTTSRPEATTPALTSHRMKGRPILSVVLLLLGLGAGVLVGRATAPERAMPADLARSELVGFLEGQREAFNSGDAARIAELYAQDATFTDIGNIYAQPIEGRDEIGEVMAKNVAFLGPFAGDIGTPIARGTFVAYVSSWGDVSAGVIVFELDVDGKILNQWVIHQEQ